MQFRKYILLCSLLWIAFASRADHAAGGYFEYTCLGNNQYEVNYYLLRDCDGVQPNENIYMYVYNTCDQTDCLQGVLMVPKAIHETVDYGCGNDCPGQGNNPGLQLARYTATITLPTQCESWIVSTSIQLRNEVDYCTPVANENYYTYCIINNTDDICNSSPRISGIPFAIGCAGQNGRSLFHVTDPDGTTLQYSFVAPQAGGCSTHQNMVFEGGASVNRPYPSSSDFDLGNDGSFTFQPNNLTGRSYFAVRVQEFNAANVLIAESVFDGMVFVSNDCETGDGIDFFDWSGTSGNTLRTSSVTEPLCGTFHLMPNDDSEFITNVTVEAPHFVDYSITYNGDGSATVDVCADFPDELLCQEIQASITVTGTTSDANCLAIVSAAGHKGYYYLMKEKGLYCPDNLFFTNRNAQSGIPMPMYAQAEERIWVGDNMPSIAPSQTEGSVTVESGTTLKAGIEIILPSCDAGTACVTLNGNIDLVIAPNSCSSECPQEPLVLSVREEFNCHSETLQAQVEGNGPFTFQWIIADDTILSSSSVLNVHSIVSEYNGGQMPYTCNVFDAAGNSGTYSGEILGTKVLYRDIRDNTIYFDYDDDHLLEDGYYYAGNPYIGTDSFVEDGQTYWLEDNPFYVYDAINENGPWYGASYMKLVVWNRWGEIVHYIERNLEGGTDWSFNQGEMYWNGYWWNGNGQTSSCVHPESEMVTYELWARNCLTPVHYEVSAIPIFSCYNEVWIPEETKSSYRPDDEVWAEHDDSRFVDLGTSASANGNIQCYPNPTTKSVMLKSDQSLLQHIAIIDINGKVVLTLNPNANSIEINLSDLEGGIYTLHLTTSEGEERIKLIKH